MATAEAKGSGIDPATVTAVRKGNRLEPGLAAFTGVTFLVYLLVKAASGAVPFDMWLVAQVAFSAALLGVGGGLMARGRYFYVAVETAEGVRRIGGLTKAEQTALAERLSPAAR
jgi:hypothetical protein